KAGFVCSIKQCIDIAGLAPEDEVGCLKLIGNMDTAPCEIICRTYRIQERQLCYEIDVAERGSCTRKLIRYSDFASLGEASRHNRDCYIRLHEFLRFLDMVNMSVMKWVVLCN